MIVLANKNDLKGEFGKKDIENLVNDYGFPFYLTSAKTGKNVNDAFHTLGKMMIKTWTEKKIGPKIEKSMVFDKEISIEVDPDKPLTALEVEDIMMARYCDLLEDPDYAMAIIREQFKKAEVDFKYPTAEGLLKVLDHLIDAASSHVEASRLKNEERTLANLIRRIG